MDEYRGLMWPSMRIKQPVWCVCTEAQMWAHANYNFGRFPSFELIGVEAPAGRYRICMEPEAVQDDPCPMPAGPAPRLEPNPQRRVRVLQQLLF